MVNTRSSTKKNMEEIVSLIDKKFDEFKASFLMDLKLELDKLLVAEKNQMNEFVDKKKVELVKASQELEIAASLKAVQVHVNKLRDENKVIKQVNNVLRTELDDLKQYTRRPNLRLYGVRKGKGETSNMVNVLVNNVCKVMCPEIYEFGSPIDRAHRIGKVISDEKGVSTQAIIIRFSTFRDRTIVYRARKDISKEYNYGISLDLIPSRLTLLNEARVLTKDVEGIQFVYSDINCFTRALLKSGEHVIFNSLSDLKNIIANL